MDLKTANLAIKRPLVFGDVNQIAAYEHLERVEAVKRMLRANDTDEHLESVRDALHSDGWNRITHRTTAEEMRLRWSQ